MRRKMNQSKLSVFVRSYWDYYLELEEQFLNTKKYIVIFFSVKLYICSILINCMAMQQLLHSRHINKQGACIIWKIIG